MDHQETFDRFVKCVVLEVRQYLKKLCLIRSVSDSGHICY